MSEELEAGASPSNAGLMGPEAAELEETERFDAMSSRERALLEVDGPADASATEDAGPWSDMANTSRGDLCAGVALLCIPFKE